MEEKFLVHRRTNREYIGFGCINNSRRFYRVLRLALLSITLLNTACSTLNSTSYDQRYTPERSAFATAARDANTWIPAVAALAIAATDSDHAISRWATEQTPLYGSQATAQDASDWLRATTATSAVLSSIIAPGQEDGLLTGRTGNLLTAATAALTTSQVTGALKDETARTRPHGEGTESFPSSHTSAASAYATISSYRVNELAISEDMRRAWRIGFHGLAAATGWARIEAESHYPTDVLVGYALGNFIAVLVHEILQGPMDSARFSLNLDHKNNQFQFNFSLPFRF